MDRASRIFQYCDIRKLLSNDLRTLDSTAYRVWMDEKVFPAVLKKFLNNPFHIKVGVSACNDAHNLEKHYGTRCQGVIDIQYIATSLGMDDLASMYTPLFHKERKTNIYTNWGWYTR